MQELEHIKSQFVQLMFEIDCCQDSKALREISRRYNVHKEKILVQHKQLERKRTMGQLTEIEGSFLYPAINEIKLSCRAARGAMDKEALSSSIYDVQDYASFYLSQLSNDK